MSTFGTPVHCNTCLQIGGLLFRTLSVLPLGSSFRYANNGAFGRLCQAKMKNRCISLPPTLDHCLTFIGCCWGGGFCQKLIVLLPCSGTGRLFRNMKTIAAGRANKKPAGNGGCNCGGSCGDASLGRYIVSPNPNDKAWHILTCCKTTKQWTTDYLPPVGHARSGRLFVHSMFAPRTVLRTKVQVRAKGRERCKLRHGDLLSNIDLPLWVSCLLSASSCYHLFPCFVFFSFSFFFIFSLSLSLSCSSIAIVLSIGVVVLTVLLLLSPS